MSELRASPANTDNAVTSAAVGAFAPAGSSLATLEEAERQHILRALRQTEWRIAGPKGAAVVLGFKKKTRQARMPKRGRRPPGSKPPGKSNASTPRWPRTRRQ